MSRILVVGINYAPENISTGKYTGEMCEWLAARGHDVRVVTAPPYYPAWSIWPMYRIRGFKRERRGGVEVIRCPIWVPEQPRGLTRILHLLSFAASSMAALLYSLKWRAELVINIAPTLASAPGALLLATLARAKSWVHVQDFEIDAALDMGIVKAGPLRQVALCAEIALLARFDVVSTISTRMLGRLDYKQIPSARQRFLPNWVDLDAIRPLTAPSRYRAELGIPADAVVALYSGNMGAKQGLELLGEAAHVLADHPNLHFVFGGEGPACAPLKSACAGLPNVHFLGLQPAENMQDWLGLADIHLLPQRADVADLVMPSKLTGMMASGRAILATALRGTGVAEALATCGRVTPPGHLDSFVEALRQLAGDPAERDRLGQAARSHAEATLGRETILSRFDHHIAQLLGAGLRDPDVPPDAVHPVEPERPASAAPPPA